MIWRLGNCGEPRSLTSWRDTVNKEEISRYELHDDCLSLQLDVRLRSLSVIAVQFVSHVRNCRFRKQCPECPVVLSNSPRHSYGDNILGLEEVKSRTGGFGFMFLLNRRVTSAYPIRSFHEVCVFYSAYFSTPYYLIRSFAYRFADLKTTRNHFDIFFCFCFCLPLFPTFLDNVKRV